MQVNYFVGAFYDSVIYLGRSLNKTIEDGQNPNDGMIVAQKLWNHTFPGRFSLVYNLICNTCRTFRNYLFDLLIPIYTCLIFITGVMGNVYIDNIGDRIADYSLLDMTDREEGIYHVRI